MTRFLALALALLALTPPALAEEEHVFEAHGLEILHPWARATRDDHALLFLELHNESAAEVTILGAVTETGAEGALVGFHMALGEMTHDALPPIPLSPDSHLDFTPDGLAILVEGLTAPLIEGEHWDITLRTSVGDIALEAEIGAKDARGHSHAGHSH